MKDRNLYSDKTQNYSLKTKNLKYHFDKFDNGGIKKNGFKNTRRKSGKPINFQRGSEINFLNSKNKQKRKNDPRNPCHSDRFASPDV